MKTYSTHGPMKRLFDHYEKDAFLHLSLRVFVDTVVKTKETVPEPLRWEIDRLSTLHRYLDRNPTEINFQRFYTQYKAVKFYMKIQENIQQTTLIKDLTRLSDDLERSETHA